MFNTRDSPVPYIAPSTKPFEEQMEEWLQWCKENLQKSKEALNIRKTKKGE